jgi:hypothetical protein
VVDSDSIVPGVTGCCGDSLDDEPVRGLANSCPSIFSIEIGNDRIRVPVA